MSAHRRTAFEGGYKVTVPSKQHARRYIQYKTNEMSALEEILSESLETGCPGYGDFRALARACYIV